MRCLAAKPIVNGIEKDLQGKAKVLRFNMLSNFGREVANRYEVQSAPTTIVLDGADNVVYRHAGIPNRNTVVAQVTAS